MKRWEIWTLVHGKRQRLEKRTWTKRGAEIWASHYPAPIVVLNGEPTPIYTFEIVRRDRSH